LASKTAPTQLPSHITGASDANAHTSRRRSIVNACANEDTQMSFDGDRCPREIKTDPNWTSSPTGRQSSNDSQRKSAEDSAAGVAKPDTEQFSHRERNGITSGATADAKIREVSQSNDPWSKEKPRRRTKARATMRTTYANGNEPDRSPIGRERGDNGQKPSTKVIAKGRKNIQRNGHKRKRNHTTTRMRFMRARGYRPKRQR
jgi:hypothetical protein